MAIITTTAPYSHKVEITDVSPNLSPEAMKLVNAFNNASRTNEVANVKTVAPINMFSSDEFTIDATTQPSANAKPIVKYAFETFMGDINSAKNNAVSFSRKEETVVAPQTVADQAPATTVKTLSFKDLISGQNLVKDLNPTDVPAPSSYVKRVASLDQDINKQKTGWEL